MFKKNLMMICALSLTLNLVGCGSSEPPATTQMPDSSLSSGITPITNEPAAITPVGDLSAGDAYDQGALPQEELPAEEIPTEEPLVEESPAEEPAVEELPTEPDTSTMPDMSVEEPYTPSTGTSSSSAKTSYAAEGSFKVDQDTFNQWQAANIASDGSSIFVSAVDSKTPAKGTVITMDASGGSWKDIGKSTLSTFSFGVFGYDMDETITGLAVDSSGNVLVSDANSKVFTLTAPDYDITETEMGISGATDIVSASGNYFIATASGIQKTDSSLASPSSFGSVSLSGGLGNDGSGNVYAVVGTSIKKLSASGTATEIVKGLSSPIDVAVDSQGNIFVLQSSSVVWFDAKGLKLGEFGSGEFQAPKAICLDSSNAVYVADAGSSHSDSAVFKYVPSSGGSGSLGDSLSDLEDL